MLQIFWALTQSFTLEKIPIGLVMIANHLMGIFKDVLVIIIMLITS